MWEVKYINEALEDPITEVFTTFPEALKLWLHLSSSDVEATITEVV